MSTSPVSQPSNASAPFRRVSDVIYRSLETALTLQCRRRHGVDTTLERIEQASSDQSMRLRLGCQDQFRMKAQITVRHDGGNVYDIRCRVEEGPSCRHTYSLPRRAGTTLSRAPYLGRKLGEFLLDALERQIGQHYLREQ